MWNSAEQRSPTSGGGGKTRSLRLKGLTALAALAALFGVALLALFALAPPAHAVPPPADVQLILGVDDEDGIIEPGQTVNVSAAIRFTGPYARPERMVAEDIELRSSLGWEGTASRSFHTLEVDDQVVVGGEWLWALRDSGGNPWYERLPNRSNVAIKAMHGRTAVARPQSNHRANLPSRDDRIYIFDIYNKRQALIIDRPAGATQTFGTSQRLHPTDQNGNVGAGTISYGINRYHDRNETGTAVAVWHETETKAWLFAGDAEAAVGAETYVGRLWIYSLEWPADQNSSAPPVATLHGYIAPPLSEAGNFYYGTANTTAHWASYGSSVAISADGSTLAVGAPWMNITGAVYVYTRPDGPGQSWADLAYADGVKVTPYPIPHWGTSEATGVAPFSSATNCDADCRAARAGWQGLLGFRNIALSADGTVMTVGAPWKDFGAQTMGGSFSNADRRAGEAYVFVAPNGDWDTAPDAVAGKTVMTAKSNAATAYPSYNKDTHVSPGPNRRVTEAAVSFVRAAWPGSTFQYTGYRVAITLDGATVAVGLAGSPVSEWNAGPQQLMIFQVDSPDEWANVQTDPWPTGTLITGLSGFGAPSWCGFDFNADGTLLMVGMCGASDAGRGEIRTIRRPADGAWDAGAINVVAPDSLQYQPSRGGRTVARSWGIVTWSIDRQRFAIGSHDEWIIEHFNQDAGSQGPGTMTFSDAGCYERRENGVSTLTCPVRLPAGAAAIVVSPGQPDGSTLTISGQVKLSMDGNDAGSETPSVYLFNHRDLENARTLQNTLVLRVGTVANLAQANLELAPRDDGGTEPASLSSGQRTVLRLQLLDENGKPARGAAIASIVATTTRGSLSSQLLDSSDAQNTNGCLAGGGGFTCQLNPALLTGADEQGALLVRNSEQGRGLAPRIPATRGLPPGETINYSSGNIRLTLEHTGTAGPADVRVHATAKNGESLSSQVVRVNLLGPPASLSIAAPAAALLNVGTPDSGVDRDDRDMLTLAVTALDKDGAQVPLTTSGSLRATLTDPEGKRVTEGVGIEWPLLNVAGKLALSADGNRQARVNVNRAAEQPLPNGEYTLEVRAGALKATQTFTVSGGPAAITLSEPEGSLERGERFSLTATIVDADGAAVPDGTKIEWLSQGVGTTPGPVRLAAETKTTNGEASAEFLSILSGTVYVTAEAGGIKQLLLLQIVEPTPPRTLIDDLSSTTPNSYAVWQGGSPIAASALYEVLPSSVVTLSRPSAAGWKHYDGGSAADFTIQPGAVLWLAGR